MHLMMPASAISPQDAIGAWPWSVRRCVAIGSFVSREVFVAPGASFASFASRFATPRPRCIATTWVERDFLTFGLPEQPLEYLVDANYKGTTREPVSKMASSKNSALRSSAEYSIQPEESTAFFCGSSKRPVGLAFDRRSLLGRAKGRASPSLAPWVLALYGLGGTTPPPPARAVGPVPLAPP